MNIIKYEQIEGKFAKKLEDYYGRKDPFIEVNPGKYIVAPRYRDFGQRILNAEVRSDDVWIASYARTGSNWTTEMVWCILNDLDFVKSKSTTPAQRFSIIEMTAIRTNHVNVQEIGETSVDQADNMASPRIIKTHLPFPLLPERMKTVKPKVIYVTRNPKDVCVSFYHFCKLFHGMCCTFDEFCDLFVHGKVCIGSIWDHVLGYWQQKDEQNLLFLKYEDMKKDMKGTIRKVSAFLDKDLTEIQVAALRDHLDFNNMKHSTAYNRESNLVQQMKISPANERDPDETFIRKGIVGDWKNRMSKEYSTKFDELTEDKLKGTTLVFETN